MASSKKAFTFRTSLDTEIKLARIETYLKTNKKFESKNLMFDFIIDVAYKTLIDGTSSISQLQFYTIILSRLFLNSIDFFVQFHLKSF